MPADRQATPQSPRGEAGAGLARAGGAPTPSQPEQALRRRAERAYEAGRRRWALLQVVPVAALAVTAVAVGAPTPLALVPGACAVFVAWLAFYASDELGGAVLPGAAMGVTALCFSGADVSAAPVAFATGAGACAGLVAANAARAAGRLLVTLAVAGPLGLLSGRMFEALVYLGLMAAVALEVTAYRR